MNFFAAQDQARRVSRRLVSAYLVATILIVLGATIIVGATLAVTSDSARGLTAPEFVRDQAPVLIATALAAAMLILGATAYKTAALTSGGGRVAVDLGGTLIPSDVNDPLRRRLRNVVEEMAIASGTPVPDIYVLEHENGINAFAAGYEPGDAAIAVTRGALELLDRDELQGVIGHEFSHILNGDMRLNIRLMGVLFGIMVLGLVGRTILRSGRYSALASSRRSRNAPAILILGLGLAVLGGVGVLAARLIKAGVSRQRETLADASAVQFTRQSAGIANALKKIGGYHEHSYLQAADPEEVSHMLFGTGAPLSGWFATHPPLTERIQALDPSFTPADYPNVDRQPLASAAGEVRESGRAAFATSSVAAAQPSPDRIAESIGRPATEHVALAADLRSSVPERLYDAAHSPELAYLLAVALVLDRSGDTLERQLSLAEHRLGRERATLIRRFYDELAATGAEYRLPLMQIAFPSLRRRPLPQLEYLVKLASDLIEVDGDIDLYEYCFYRMLVANLERADNPSRTRRRQDPGREPVRKAAIDLLAILARHGNTEDGARQQAFHAGVATFGNWSQRYAYDPGRRHPVRELDRVLDLLLALNGEGRQMLLQAVTATVLADGRFTLAEAELLRAVCASLDCPMPPILLQQPVT